jgi:glycosyltransferase involved in cell wall biosynthesis
LARGIVDAGHDVLLFTTGDSTCPVPRAWELERAEGERIGAAPVEVRHALAAYEATKDADIVHDHTLAGLLEAGRSPGRVTVTTNHGPFEGELGAIYRAVSHRVPVIAVSQHHASTAHGISVGAVIHHGLDVDTFPAGLGDGGYALFLGRMSPDKGAARAARTALRAGVPLKIAAKMREKAELEYFEAEVRPLLGPNVEYVGEVGSAEKRVLLAGAVALLNPIAWPEPFGMVMIEALACGTPVVASRIGSAPEIVDHGVTGFLAAGEEATAAALLQAGGLDRRMCRQAVARRFSADRMVQNHLRFYREVLEQRSRPTA